MSRKLWLQCGFVLLAATGAAGALAAAPPIAHFFDNPHFGGARLSPDARYLAVRVGNTGRRDGLAVIDLATREAKAVAQFNDADIGDFEWVNDQRLVFNTHDKNVAPGDRRMASGLYAANRDGSAARQLADRSYATPNTTNSMIVSRLLPWNTYLLDQVGAQDSDYIYVQNPVWDDVSYELHHVDLFRLNTVTGKADYIPRPAPVTDWLLDDKGLPRLAMSWQQDKVTTHFLDPASRAWRTLATFPAYGDATGRFTPIGFSAEGKLLVKTNAGQDKKSLRVLDVASGAIDPQALVSLADYDYNGEAVYSNGKLLGFEVLSDARAMVWLDDGMKAIQQAVDAQLPGTVNLLRPAARPQAPWMLVQSYSDQQPLTYLLFNTETRKLSKIGSVRDGINPAEMGQQDLMRFAARDGLSIPAWLTLPQGKKKNLPLVLLVHGGPSSRGREWEWDAETQFLASRGYAVLEPEFRGSAGFGNKHFRAGLKQWGLAMQDDLADAAQWAIAQGIADPKRICIAGASYGGYATLMGLVKNPELFKCGINWVGVTDIELMYKDNSYLSDLPQAWKEYGMPQRIGDPVKDAAQLKATSPLNLAARIRQPVLMAYGTEDRRVPLYHGRKFLDAVKAGGNQDVELVIYNGEGHGWALAKNRIDFWSRVEQFLAKNIGQPGN
ncbi:MAG: alpha/beta fold hydrolase [Pseudomonadota bacterium]